MMPPAKPLAQIPSGQTVELVGILGGRGIRSRLEQIGFSSGIRVRVEKNDRNSGPVMVDVRGSIYMLGRGESQQVFVR